MKTAVHISIVASILVAGPWEMAASDMALVEANMGRQSGATNPVTILHPQLHVTPGRKTLMAGEELRVTATGATNDITWFAVEMPSGGRISADGSNAVMYTAGSTSSRVDVIEAWDGYNSFGRVYFNVIDAEDMAEAGKAVILAGSKGKTDPLWPTTDYLADSAYNVLLYRGYSKDNVHYLSVETGQDVDGDGVTDDVDMATTYTNTEHIFTTRVGHADKLFVYCVDHGGDSGGAGYFRLNENETLPAAQLDAWLDNIQDTYNTEVTVVIDCCHAGSFVDELAYTGTATRIVMASCGTNEPAYFVAGGLVSFSDAFFGGIMQGHDVRQAYAAAESAMSTYQESMYDDNEGGAAAHGEYVGATFVAGKDIPQIGTVCGNQLLTSGTEATLWADDIASLYEIERVWCLVVPPGHNPTNPANPVSDVPEIDLAYDTGEGRYQGLYDGFSQEGTYKVVYYARDSWNSVSSPRQSYVVQSAFNERVILVAGGETNAQDWAAIDNMARSAYHTFLGRWFDPTNVQYLSNAPFQDTDSDGSNDVDAACTLANVGSAITDWAAKADKVTVYCLADGTAENLTLNSGEILTATTLDGWLDQLQASNCEACVVLEAPESGSFLDRLKPEGEQSRICLASCREGQQSCWANNGWASFSRYLLAEIFSGSSVGDAFDSVRTRVRRVSGRLRQRPELDDDGDGQYDRKLDGQVARQFYIGTAFRTGDDAPVIGQVGPGGTNAMADTVTLWASGITDVDGISNVWCLVTAPDYDGVGDLPCVTLAWDVASFRYEAPYANAGQMGAYAFTFVAEDVNGEVSVPVQSALEVTDAYEPDDTTADASPFMVGGSQLHNLHTSNDVDWVQLFVPPDETIQISARQVGTNVNLMLEVFYRTPDGIITNIDWLTAADQDEGSEVVEATDIDLKTYSELQPGFYYVRVQPEDPAFTGAESSYELCMETPVGGGGDLWAMAVDVLSPDYAPPPGAVAVVDGVHTQEFKGARKVVFAGLPDGVHTVEVRAATGYLPDEDAQRAGQVRNELSEFFGNPKARTVTGEQPVFAYFGFVPVVQVDAVVRDAWTGERIAGAAPLFTATNGVIAGQVYRRYPNHASYATNWQTAADGAFPADVLLPAVDWDVAVSAAAHRVWSRTGAVTGQAPGAAVDLGVISLTPVDANSNRIADAWEAGHGASDPDGDPDRDGHTTRTEYMAGTDPTNKASVLALEPLVFGTNGVLLRWPVAGGRVYAAEGASSLGMGHWSLITEPHEATQGMTHMQTVDTNQSNRFYRVGIRK